MNSICLLFVILIKQVDLILINDGHSGEDPVEVKARLKVWAQAVALASTTHHLGS